MTLVQKLDCLVPLKHLLGARSVRSQGCKKVIGRQHSNGRVIAFKCQDTGLKEIKQGNSKALIAGEGNLKFLISGKASFHFLVIVALQ